MVTILYSSSTYQIEAKITNNYDRCIDDLFKYSSFINSRINYFQSIITEGLVLLQSTKVLFLFWCNTRERSGDVRNIHPKHLVPQNSNPGKSTQTPFRYIHIYSVTFFLWEQNYNKEREYYISLLWFCFNKLHLGPKFSKQFSLSSWYVSSITVSITSG